MIVLNDIKTVIDLSTKFCVFTASYYLARYADLGLANIAGLVTFRHGTNPVSWTLIHLFGARPSLEGAKTGGSGMLQDKQDPRFYVARGLESRVICAEYRLCSTVHLFPSLSREFLNGPAVHRVAHIGVGSIHALVAPLHIARIGTMLLSESPSQSRSGRVAKETSLLAKSVVCSVGSFFPLIRMRFSEPEASKWFVPDRTEPGAFSTNYWIPPFRNGLVGTIFAAFTPRTVLNMWSQKNRVLTGLAQVAITGAVAYCGSSLYTSHKTAILAGALLAIV